MTEITIIPEGELDLSVTETFAKLPGDAIHNHLHRVAEGAKAHRAHLEKVELAGLILCAVELDTIKGEPLRRNGSPWKEWVAENCDFSHKTATKYAQVLKAGRAGRIPGLVPDAIPEIAPSAMSGDQLRDACGTLAASLDGLGGIRQLYLELEIIAPGNKPPKPNAKGGTADPDITAQEQVDIDTQDAVATYRKIIAALDKAQLLGKPAKLPPTEQAEIKETLTSLVAGI